MKLTSIALMSLILLLCHQPILLAEPATAEQKKTIGNGRTLSEMNSVPASAKATVEQKNELTRLIEKLCCKN